MTINPESALVLFSGGQDSTVCLAWALERFARVETLGFDYGQRHIFELEAARHIAKALGAADHRVTKIDLRLFGGSALTDSIDVPKHRTSGIPITYVPARNTIFLSLAMGWAEVLGAAAIYIGVNALDYSGYPDCRESFLQSFRAMWAEAVPNPPRIVAPLVTLGSSPFHFSMACCCRSRSASARSKCGMIRVVPDKAPTRCAG